MRLPCLRFTVRRMMIVVLLFALAFFTYGQLHRSYSPALDRNSGRFLVVSKSSMDLQRATMRIDWPLTCDTTMSYLLIPS